MNTIQCIIQQRLISHNKSSLVTYNPLNHTCTDNKDKTFPRFVCSNLLYLPFYSNPDRVMGTFTSHYTLRSREKGIERRKKHSIRWRAHRVRQTDIYPYCHYIRTETAIGTFQLTTICWQKLDCELVPYGLTRGPWLSYILPPILPLHTNGDGYRHLPVDDNLLTEIGLRTGPLRSYPRSMTVIYTTTHTAITYERRRL